MVIRERFSYQAIHDVLNGLLKQDVHAKRVNSLCDATLGVLHSGSLAVCTIGQGLAAALRDTKDLRFGMGLGTIHVNSAERRDRLWLINAFAVVLLTLLGAAGEALGYDRMLKASTVKRRVHSLFRQGCMLYDLLPATRDA